MSNKFVILVVDDNPSNRLSLCALLSRLPDCEVLEADSGEATLLLTVERAIHLILLDVQMPGMDGFETARHLQMTERTRNIPIVFVTAVFKADEFIAKGYGLGAVDYLTKPIDDNLMFSRVRLYQHLRERELKLEESVRLLLIKERALSKAKNTAEAITRQLAISSEERRKLSQVVEQSPNSIIITDIEGTIEYVNPRFVEHTGYTAAEAIGNKPRIIKSDQTTLAIHQELWGTILSGRIWRGELLNRKKNGTTYWAETSIAPVHDANQSVTHFVAIYVDITDKVLAQEVLRSAKEEAERANRSKSVFLANMSHELRTPLNAILGFTRLLERDESMSGENCRKLTTINRAGQHLLALINDVLEISRIEAGRTKIKVDVVDLGEMLNEIEDMIRLRAEDKKLGFAVERCAGLPTNVMSDAQHLKQILINLLGNAVKYTDQGQISLRVSPVEGQVRFDVADTGPGISREEQENLFRAFYQTEVGIAKGEGTGLGLNISYEYARLLGGELSVASQPGQGSVFTLSVPLPATDATAPSRSTHGRVIGLEAESGKPRILVVDDNADNRDYVCEMLNMAGFEVREVDDGQQAIDAFASWQPGLILMDVRMPVMDGYEATRRIRMLPHGREVKIVALTASVFEEDGSKVLEAGCDKMVKKPIEEDELFEAMGELLEIHFRYDEEAASAALPIPAGEIDMSALPLTLRSELKAASDGLDIEAVSNIVERIRQEQSAQLAARLSELAGQYRFDRIAELCKL